MQNTGPREVRYVRFGYTATLPSGRTVTTERSYPLGLPVPAGTALRLAAQRAFPFEQGGNLEFRTLTQLFPLDQQPQSSQSNTVRF